MPQRGEDQEAVSGDYSLGGDRKVRKDGTMVHTYAWAGASCMPQIPSANLSSLTGSLQGHLQLHELPGVNLEAPGLGLASISTRDLVASRVTVSPMSVLQMSLSSL